MKDVLRSFASREAVAFILLGAAAFVAVGSFLQSNGASIPVTMGASFLLVFALEEVRERLQDRYKRRTNANTEADA